MDVALATALGYLLGSIPTGYLLTRWVARQDLRAIGSGGTGATNAQRALGWRWGIAVAVADVLKGVFAVLVARWLGAGALAESLAALAATAAHCWPVWLGFRGGKGVATGGGAAMALSPWALLLVPILIVPVALTRYVSLGSLIGALATPLLFAVLVALDRAPAAYLVFAVVAPAIIIARHRGNIARLRDGSERKLGSGGPSRTATAA